MRLTAAGASLKGRRENNEDSIGLFPDSQVFAIADGMGGLEFGERMSQMVVEAVQREAMKFGERARATDTEDERRVLFDRVVRFFEELAIDTFSFVESQGIRMGTTLTVAVFSRDRVTLGHVGDTRAYRVREGRAERLTTDHSLAAYRLAKGEISLAEYEKSPQRHMLYECLGPVPEVTADASEVGIDIGDTIVLCTDGVWGAMSPEELVACVDGLPPKDGADSLVATAISNGGRDNATALVIQVEGVAEPTAEPVPMSLVVSELFRDFNPADLRLLVPYVEHQALRPGETVINQGEQGQQIYIIESGAVVIERDSQVLGHLNAGAHFGEISFATNGLRTASVRAIEDTSLLVLDQNAIRDLCARRPDLGVRILTTLLGVVATRLLVRSAEPPSPKSVSLAALPWMVSPPSPPSKVS
ncbi:MAG: cyclic nucleotide-binding domain-containing protein, partial [Myxococcota bacterium]|nr:cyclic nucleotide-binding domain-containing protein [Myxococcota bacterium]